MTFICSAGPQTRENCLKGLELSLGNRGRDYPASTLRFRPTASAYRCRGDDWLATVGAFAEAICRLSH
jgi:hypothetical protein